MSVTTSPDVASLAVGIDSCLDAAVDYLVDTDLSALPSAVRQALALATAAGDLIDQLLASLEIDDDDGGG
ncbi:MAG: hypothetical protein ABSH29_24745 [Acidimicrobiales bacterium]|jgi:hypothetical protein